MIEAEVVATRPDIRFLSGSVKLDNIASKRIFEDNGYEKGLIEGENEHFNYRKRIESSNADRFIDVVNIGIWGIIPNKQ